MEEDSPYQTPPSSRIPPLPVGEEEPGSIQVFAIIHLVFAGLGTLAGLWSIASLFVGTGMSGIGVPKGPQRDALLEAQRNYMGEIGWVSVMTGVFMLILAGMLLVAGLKLLRRELSGLYWSNRYAWTSIGTKLVSIVVGVLVVFPASKRMFEVIVNGMPGSGDLTQKIMSISTSASVVFGPVISMIYPVLALVMLNRLQVKRFLHP